MDKHLIPLVGRVSGLGSPTKPLTVARLFSPYCHFRGEKQLQEKIPPHRADGDYRYLSLSFLWMQN